jgi:hypothetical protein
MLTDDLVGGVSLEPLCSGVPIDHYPVRIDHINRVVANRLNQEPVTPSSVNEPSKFERLDFVILLNWAFLGAYDPDGLL